MISNTTMFILSVIVAISFYYLNMWAVPKLQQIHFEKRMELQQLKLEYEAQQKAKEILSKEIKKSKDNKKDK